MESKITIFKDMPSIQDGDIVYLCEYIPYNRDPENTDKRSMDFVLSFKKKEDVAISLACDMIVPNLGKDFAIAVVPSSKVENNYNSASHQLASIILEKLPKSNITDASRCLYRHTDMPAQHQQSGKRDPSILLQTLEVHNPENVRGKDVLVLDDLTTSGNSINTASYLLKQAGAQRVVGLVIGKTVQEENLECGFIFDIDQTLFDTSAIEPYRPKDWDTAIKMAAELEPYDGIEELFALIRRDYGGHICLVTSSARKYAEVLARKLGIDSSHVVAAGDYIRGKPDIEPYCIAKKILQIYDPCIIAVGDREKDIIPANELYMTSVLANWGGNEQTERASFTFSTVKDMLANMDEVTKNARIIRDRYTR